MLKGYRLGQIRRGQIWRRTEIHHLIDYIHEHQHDTAQDTDLPLKSTSTQSAGVIFIPGNGEGPGVRLRKDGER